MTSASDGLIVEKNEQSIKCPRNWLLGIAIFFLYGISLWIMLKFMQHFSNNGLFPFFGRQIHQDILDRLDLDCEGVIRRNRTVMEKLKTWRFNETVIQEKLGGNFDVCHTIRHLFTFNKEPLSQEEADYPLAYGMVVYKHISQLLFMLSSFYHPQNAYCIAVSGSATPAFKRVAKELPKCFPNIHIMMRPAIQWGSFEIINSTYACFEYLSRLEQHNWQYYQYLAGVDAPLKTNLEMVRIFKALNGNVNVEVSEFQNGRLRKKNFSSPLPLYKSSLSPLIPRATANHICASPVTKKLLRFLKGTSIPDEAFWGTLTGNVRDFPIPGAFDAGHLLEVRRNWTRERQEKRANREEHGKARWRYYISREQVWVGRQCGGKMSSGSCVFGLSDLASLLQQPPPVAHKFYMDYQPAGYFCLLKELRKRSHLPVQIDVKPYTLLPQYELQDGVAPENLSHPNWL